MGLRSRLVPIAFAAGLALAPAPQGPAPSAPRARLEDLAALFTGGGFLQDENEDGVLDTIRARIVLPASPTPHALAAAANIAARLGFETSAFTPDLAARDGDVALGADTPPLVLVGGSNALVRRLQSDKKLDWGDLGPGEGAVAIVPGAFGGTDALVVAGADDRGTAAAAEAAAARLPYLWQLRSDSVASVQRDLARLLAAEGAQIRKSYAPLAVYGQGKQQVRRLVVVLELSTGADRAVAFLERIAAAHVVGKADFTRRRADLLNYHGLQTLEVRIAGAKTVRIDRFGPPYRSNFPANPWKAPVKSLDLASLYSTRGIYGDSRGNDLIPDESETLILIGPAAGSTLGAVDLAARIALETTGVSLPLVRVESDIEDLSKIPNPVLIGPSDRLSWPRPPAAPLAGEGSVEIVPAAFGTYPAIVVSASDAAGLDAATRYLAGRVPYLGVAKRGEPSFEDIEEELRAFFRARSSAGQAARATEELESILDGLQGKELASVEVQAYLEEGSPELAAFFEARIRERTGASSTARADSRYGPVKIFEEMPELGWEVDELRERFRAEVLPKVAAGSRVELEVLASESPEQRRDLERELTDAVKKAGAAEVTVRVLCAYKQGFSWLADSILPAVRGKPVASVTVFFPTAKYPAGEPFYGLPIRWLQEIFPADEILSRELSIDVDAVRFEKVDDGPVVYRVEVKDRAGRILHQDTFAPRYVEREYFPQKPTATIQVTTGGMRARVNGDTVADFNVRTDPERFWDFYQKVAIPRMFDYARTYTGGRLGLSNQPFFRDLIFDITMSEPDFVLELDEERISSLDSLHEDLMFNTIDFWAIFSGKNPGSREVAPGRIMPFIHPVEAGRPPRVKITFNGNAAPRPRLAVSWQMRSGQRESRSLDLDEVAVEPARVTAVGVRAGAERVTRLTASVAGKSFEAASTAARMVELLGGIQRAGAFRNTLAYGEVDELAVSAESGTLRLVRKIVPVDRESLRRSPLAERMAEPGKRIVTWDHVIGPDELEDAILPRLASFPEIHPYVAGRSYRGRSVWAMDVRLPGGGALWSQAKASATKPVLFISTRQHANEVSATSAHLRFMELVATDPEYRKYLKRMNIVYNPMENPDGAANHHEFYKLQPTYILHGGYWSSVARDVSAYVWDPDPLLPEGLVRRKLYYTWLPDVYLNPHGYPSHEWVHQFAGYKVPWFLAFWIPRGYHINLHHLDDPNYPDHKAAGRELRERIIEEVQGVPEIRAANERLIHRFEKYARRYEPDPFRLEVYQGMNILYDHSYSFAVGGPGSREIFVSSLWRRPDPEGDSFLEKHPQLTVLDLGCDMPDETASPEWMEKVAARGQFGYLMSVVKLLYESDWKVLRFEEDFQDRVRLSIFRPRPVKASRGAAERKATAP